MDKPAQTFLAQPYTTPDNASSPCTFVGFGMNTSYNSPGVEYAADVIRRISQRYANASGVAQPLQTFNPERGYILRGIRLEDAGTVMGTGAGGLDSEITQIVSQLLARDSLPLVIGGDHYISLPVIAAYSNPVTVIQFDAHGDYLDEAKECPHGSVMRLVNDLPCVRRIIHTGLRGNLNTGPGIRDSLARGNVVLTSTNLRESGTEILLRLLQPHEAVYVTFDGDFLDPSIAPAVGYAEPEGIDYKLARELLCGVAAKADIKGIDFVEYNPEFDWNAMTGIHLVNLIMEFLSVQFGNSRI